MATQNTVGKMNIVVSASTAELATALNTAQAKITAFGGGLTSLGSIAKGSAKNFGQIAESLISGGGLEGAIKGIGSQMAITGALMGGLIGIGVTLAAVFGTKLVAGIFAAREETEKLNAAFAAAEKERTGAIAGGARDAIGAGISALTPKLPPLQQATEDLELSIAKMSSRLAHLEGSELELMQGKIAEANVFLEGFRMELAKTAEAERLATVIKKAEADQIKAIASSFGATLGGLRFGGGGGLDPTRTAVAQAERRDELLRSVRGFGGQRPEDRATSFGAIGFGSQQESAFSLRGQQLPDLFKEEVDLTKLTNDELQKANDTLRKIQERDANRVILSIAG